jgi:uncharacterized integral membrane protein (TIGR00697 family)
MENLIILFSRALIELLGITILARLGKIWLYGAILINLVLITILGSKTVIILGVTTNTGNVFYASIIYAIYLLLEHYDKKSAIQSIWFGTTFILFFLLMNEFTVTTTGSPATRTVDEAMRTLLQSVPRVSFASIAAFIPSQYLNIYLYEFLRKRMNGARLWLRNIISLFVTEIVDSAIFFPIAFFGVLSHHTILEIMLTGFALKIFVGVLSTPFLYISRALQKE